MGGGKSQRGYHLEDADGLLGAKSAASHGDRSRARRRLRDGAGVPGLLRPAARRLGHSRVVVGA